MHTTEGLLGMVLSSKVTSWPQRIERLLSEQAFKTLPFPSSTLTVSANIHLH